MDGPAAVVTPEGAEVAIEERAKSDEATDANRSSRPPDDTTTLMLAPLDAFDPGPMFRVTATGLRVNGEPSDVEWDVAGACLLRAERALQFAMGDWWASYGQRRYYGERAQRVRQLLGSEDDGGLLQRFMNYAWVARRIEPSRRREDVSFSHHAEVAALEPPDQDRLLEQASANKWSVRRLRREACGLRAAEPGMHDEPESGVDNEPVNVNAGSVGDDVGEPGAADIATDTGDKDAAEPGTVERLSDDDHGRRLLSSDTDSDLSIAASSLEMEDECAEVTLTASVIRALQHLNVTCECRDWSAICEHQREFEGAVRHALTHYTVEHGEHYGNDERSSQRGE
jgi:hypothetical protein